MAPVLSGACFSRQQPSLATAIDPPHKSALIQSGWARASLTLAMISVLDKLDGATSLIPVADVAWRGCGNVMRKQDLFASTGASGSSTKASGRASWGFGVVLLRMRLFRGRSCTEMASDMFGEQAVVDS